ncbi:MAG: hypothetical protein CR955_00115 [Thiotrichales bacterium]|nr:MAG: hypothetical protein CR955_00115 [Thiotrichales bacterium]
MDNKGQRRHTKVFTVRPLHEGDGEQQKALINLPSVSISRHTAHRKRSLHGVNKHFEHRVTQTLARAGGFAKPSRIHNSRP